MNKNVLNKLSKIESKVELGAVQDFEQSVNLYFAQSGKIEEQVQLIENSIKGMQNAFVEAQKIASKIDSEYQKLRKQALDLGVEIPTTIENDYKKMLAVLKNDLATFKMYNK